MSSLLMERAESLSLDAANVARARNGDVAAFESLYYAHHGRVFALTLRMTREALLAEELTQDVFVRAWGALPSFRGDSAFATWLHRIAVHVTLNALAKEQRRLSRFTREEDIQRLGLAARQAMPETDIDLERAIAAVPPRARAVLVLHDVEGYRYEEIAEMLGVAVGTIKSQLHRARRLVMERMKS